MVLAGYFPTIGQLDDVQLIGVFNTPYGFQMRAVKLSSCHENVTRMVSIRSLFCELVWCAFREISD